MSGKTRTIEEVIEESTADYRDTEIEYQLLAYLIRVSPAAVGNVNREWFSDVLIADLFDIVNDLRIVMSSSMLAREVKSRKIARNSKEMQLYKVVIEQLFDLEVESSTDKGVRHMMQQLLDLYDSRRVLTACGEIALTTRNFDLEKAKRRLATVSKPTVLTDEENSGYYLDHYGHRVDVILDKQERVDETEDGTAGVKTGIYEFDRMSGGLMAGEFGIVLGVTGVGKTAALIEFGASAYESGHNVLIGSGEMSLDELAFRIDARFTRIPGMKFRVGDLTDDEMSRWGDVIKLYQSDRDNVLFLSSYSRRFTVEDLDRDRQRVEEETGKRIDMVCMDYINIMDPIRAGRSDAKDQSEAVWDFKGFCKENRIVGWTAGQVVDDAYDKELYDASDAKYARALSEAAPVIVALIQTDRDRINEQMKLQVIKMRNAPVPKTPIRLVPNLSIMRLDVRKHGAKSLLDLQSKHVQMERKARKPKPKKVARGS